MEKRLIMCFTKYGERNRDKLLRFLEFLEERKDINIELANVSIDPNDKSNPIVEKYNIKSTPTLILLQKEFGKDRYIELRRISKNKFSDNDVLDFLNDNLKREE